MKEKDMRASILALVTILVIVILGLVTYIIFDKKNVGEVYINCEDNKKDDISSNLDTKKEEKIINLEINENGKLDTIHYYYDNFDYSLVYILNSNSSKIEIKYADGFTNFIINNDEYGNIYTPDTYILNNVVKYNDYLFITLSCACDIPSRYFMIDLKNKMIDDTRCVPNDNGMCSGIYYEKTFGSKYNEVNYNINYETKEFNKIKEEQLDCKEYNANMYYDNSCGNDEICKRRLSFCYPLV